jgi:hypothetical protein
VQLTEAEPEPPPSASSSSHSITRSIAVTFTQCSGDLIQINEPAGGHGSHDAGNAGRAARREGLAMRDRSRPLLDREAVYTVVGVIGFGILPIVLAIAMLFFS